MANALAMFRMQRMVQGASGVQDAYNEQLYALMKADAVQMQMREVSERADIEIGQIFQKGEEVVADQTQAFIKGGVEITGSAMQKIGETMSLAAEAALVRRREADFQLKGLGIEKASLETSASDTNMLLNALSEAGSAYTGYQADKAYVNRGSRGGSAKGIENSTKVLKLGAN